MFSVLPLDGFRHLVADLVFAKQLEEVVGAADGIAVHGDDDVSQPALSSRGPPELPGLMTASV